MLSMVLGRPSNQKRLCVSQVIFLGVGTFALQKKEVSSLENISSLKSIALNIAIIIKEVDLLTFEIFMISESG